ncbi:hypothetical protein [Micromonospora sp. NPDC005254]|uniref:hypothetical protein n=1 Tax=Micromonospora sp. NPDC005254 TaxID=3364229 RepID=UPI003680D98E
MRSGFGIRPGVRIVLLTVVLLVPSLLTALLVVRNEGRHQPSGTPDVQPVDTASTPPATVRADVVPFQIGALAMPLKTGEKPPPARTCAEAMNWMRAIGGAAIGEARAEISIRVPRRVQVNVRDIRVRTVDSEAVDPRAAVVCTNSDYTVDPRPGNWRFAETFGILGAPASTKTEVVQLARPEESVDRPAVRMSYLGVTSEDLDVPAGGDLRVPFYVTGHGGPAHRIGFQIEVDVTINGVQETHILDDGGRPFSLYDSTLRYLDANYDWLADKREWVVNGGDRTISVAPATVPTTRWCKALSLAEVRRVLRQWVEAQSFDSDFRPSCAWFDGAVRLNLALDLEPDEASARAEFASMRNGTLGLGGGIKPHVVDIGDEAVAAAGSGIYEVFVRSGAEMMSLTLGDPEFRNDPAVLSVLVELARTAAERLW